MVYRHEVKYMITPAQAAAIRANISAVAPSDTHVGSDGCYTIRSLYFDDPFDTALREKQDGVNEREKYRIRYYDGDTSFIMLECKQKRDGVGRKLQARLSVEEVEKILNGSYDWMLSCDRPLVRRLYNDIITKSLRPKTVVQYRRRPFMYKAGNVRVTLDWDIRAGKPSEFLVKEGIMLPTEGNVILLEVKWDNFLPGVIRDAVALKGCTDGAFSKYSACRLFF